MSEMSMISVVSLLGFLILAASALASYRLSWGKAARLALVWLAIFSGLFMLVQLFGLEL